MAISFAGFAEVARFILGYAVKGVTEGLTAEEIGRATEPLVGEWAETDWTPFVSSLQEAIPGWSQIRQVPYEHTISEEFSFVNPQNQREQYRYNVNVSVHNKDTDEYYSTWYTVESETLLSRADIADSLAEIEGLPTGSGSEYILSINSYEFFTRAEG